MARRERKTAAQAWLEKWNPLQGMSIREAQGIFDAARGGDTQRLHWLFQEIEATNPVLLVCVERRASALANFQWKISELAASDGALSAEQKDACERLLNGVENFTDALEHLGLAFFRGFAHAQPVWESDGTVREISLLDSWKFVRQGGAWFYNPECTGLAGNLQPTDRCGLMTVVRRRPVDYPALGIHIRHAVGSRDWGRFLERYALPKPAAFMHPGATEEQKADYLEAANAVENGQVSVWPNGASLTDFAGGSRGTDPFAPFIEHQEKQIVLLATGGTLMSIAESGSGTLAGGAQADVWESIVARDSAVVAQAVQRALVAPYLERAFPGRPCAVRFGFDFTKPPTPKEVFEVAAIAKQAGWTIDKAQLEEQTGYTLVQDAPQQLPAGGLSASPSGGFPFMNKAPAPEAAAPEASDATDGVLAAFARDTGPAADAVRALLADPTPEAARDLLARLPSLIPEDPALAAVLAEEMAKEFGTVASDSSDAVANKEGECRAQDPAHCPTHGVPASKETAMPRVKSSPLADSQCVKLGYSGVKDMVEKSADVAAERIAYIHEGFHGSCKAHEAIAVILRNEPFHDSEGNQITFGDDILQHYIEGKRRKGNEPKVENLTELPYAIKAVRNDIYGVTRLKYPEGASPDPVNPPRGSQREYHLDTGHGMMKVFVYISGGKINGWHIQSRMKKPR